MGWGNKANFSSSLLESHFYESSVEPRTNMEAEAVREGYNCHPNGKCDGEKEANISSEAKILFLTGGWLERPSGKIRRKRAKLKKKTRKPSGTLKAQLLLYFNVGFRGQKVFL